MVLLEKADNDSGQNGASGLSEEGEMLIIRLAVSLVLLLIGEEFGEG